MKFYLSLCVGKIIAILIRFIDKKRGTNLSGEIALKIDPNMIKHFKGIDYSKVLLITGTNGKSSTNNLINHIFKVNGKKIVTNLEGANLLSGIATSMLKASNLSGVIDADFLIFETDERTLPLIYPQIPAKNIIIINLQKDQIQRNGDPDFIYRKLMHTFNSKELRIFVNNEEPRSKAFEDIAKETVSYSVVENEKSFYKDGSYVSMPCTKCYNKITFEYYNTDGIGKFTCIGCDHKSDMNSNYKIEDIDFSKAEFKCQGVIFQMPYTLPYMLYNYAAAIATSREIGKISMEDISKSFLSFKNIGGRYELMKYKDKIIKFMWIKQENPETLQSCLNEIASDTCEKAVCFGLGIVKDFIPYYTGMAYTYDCDFSQLANANVEKFLCFSDVVCFDTANRLIYEGIDRSKISIYENEDLNLIFDEIEKLNAKTIYLTFRLKSFEKIREYIDKEGRK